MTVTRRQNPRRQNPEFGQKPSTYCFYISYTLYTLYISLMQDLNVHRFFNSVILGFSRWRFYWRGFCRGVIGIPKEIIV
jgi:hypothetical protein